MAFEGVRDWYERSNPREKRMLFLLGLTFVVCVFAFFGYRIRDGLRAIGQRNAAMQAALKTLDEHRGELAAGGQVDSVKARLSGKAPSLGSYLEGIASEVGVQMPESSDRKPETKNGFDELVIDVKLRGVTIEQLAQFLNRVETRHPAVVTQRVYVRRYFNQNEKLDVELTVAAYQNPEKKAETKKDEKGGAKGGGG